MITDMNRKKEFLKILNEDYIKDPYIESLINKDDDKDLGYIYKGINAVNTYISNRLNRDFSIKNSIPIYPSVINRPNDIPKEYLHYFMVGVKEGIKKFADKFSKYL